MSETRQIYVRLHRMEWLPCREGEEVMEQDATEPIKQTAQIKALSPRGNKAREAGNRCVLEQHVLKQTDDEKKIVKTSVKYIE